MLAAHVKPERQQELRKIVLAQLSTIFDYRDNLVQPSMVEEREISPNDRYLRWRKISSTYTDETGNAVTVPGVSMNVDKIVMRTDGIVVDAVLGQGEALDTYSHGLQTQAVRQRQLNNDREALGQKVVTDTDNQKARIYKDVFPRSVALPGKISVSASDIRGQRLLHLRVLRLRRRLHRRTHGQRMTSRGRSERGTRSRTCSARRPKKEKRRD